MTRTEQTWIKRKVFTANEPFALLTVYNVVSPAFFWLRLTTASLAAMEISRPLNWLLWPRLFPRQKSPKVKCKAKIVFSEQTAGTSKGPAMELRWGDFFFLAMSKWKNHKNPATFITCRPFWFTEVKRVSTTNTLLSYLFFIYFFKCAIKKNTTLFLRSDNRRVKILCKSDLHQTVCAPQYQLSGLTVSGEKLGWDPAFADKNGRKPIFASHFWVC